MFSFTKILNKIKSHWQYIFSAFIIIYSSYCIVNLYTYRNNALYTWQLEQYLENSVSSLPVSTNVHQKELNDIILNKYEGKYIGQFDSFANLSYLKERDLQYKRYKLTSDIEKRQFDMDHKMTKLHNEANFFVVDNVVNWSNYNIYNVFTMFYYFISS